MSYAMGAHGVSGIQLRPAREPAAWTAKQRIASTQSGGLAGSPTEVQLQLVRYDGLPGLTLQLQGIEHAPAPAFAQSVHAWGWKHDHVFGHGGEWTYIDRR